MKKFILILIRFYQNTSFFHKPIFRALFMTDKVCRFIPTCSEYTYQAVEKYGSLKGLWLGFKRIIRCHPWSKGGLDPIPKSILAFNYEQEDVLALCFLIIFAVASSLYFQANLFLSTLLFFGLPSIYLSIKSPEDIKKTFTYALLTSIPGAIIFDYLAQAGNSWYIPETIVPFRILDRIPIEQIIWGFLYVYLIVIFYEYFINKNKGWFGKKIKYLVGIELFISLLFVFLLFFNPRLLFIPYFYFWIPIVLGIVPMIIAILKDSKIIDSLIKITLYNFVLALSFEITALKLNQWIFPGDHYLGKISLFNETLPIEEFIFFIVLGGAGILSWYILFASTTVKKSYKKT